MTPDLAGFSEWTLALLPRLFLFPGGLGLLLALLAVEPRIAGHHTSSPLRSLARSLARADLPHATLAWAGVALLPFPGPSPLPFAPDHLALTLLLALSFAFYQANTGGSLHAALAGGAMVAANVSFAVAAGGGGLLYSGAGGAWLQLACLAGATVASLTALEARGGAWALQALAWLALGASPLWALLDGWPLWAALPGLAQATIAGALLVLAALGVRFLSRALAGYRGAGLTSAWLLALLGLLAHLLHRV